MSLDIEIKNARVYFPVKSGYVRAVDGISATFKEGEITGIIGESGCGKSVLGMYLLGMLPDYAVKSGEIWYDGKNLETFSPDRVMRKAPDSLRKRMALIFSSLFMRAAGLPISFSDCRIRLSRKAFTFGGAEAVTLDSESRAYGATRRSSDWLTADRAVISWWMVRR